MLSVSVSFMKFKALGRKLAWSASRLLALPEHPHQPALSAVGWVAATAMFAVVLTIVTAMSFALGVRNDLVSDARQSLKRVEDLFAAGLSDLAALPEPLLQGCPEALVRQLTLASLDSVTLQRVHRASPAFDALCSPVGNLSGRDIGMPLRQARSAYAGPSAAFLITRSQGRSSRVLLARQQPTDEWLIGELSNELVSRVLVYETLVADQGLLLQRDGKVLVASAPTASAGSGLAVRWLTLNATRYLSATQASVLFPVEVTVMPSSALIVSRAGWHLVTLGVLVGLAALLVVASGNRLLLARTSIERRLRLALRRRQFEPVIQPIVDARTGKCKGGEILMRWRHPARGLLTPVEFLAIAEQTGLIVEMTTLIMNRARYILADVSRLNPELYFSFNLVAAQLRDPSLPDTLDAIFDDNSLPARNIVIEIVEREAIDNGVRDVLDELRRRGYRVAIDDFGTGQSSLALLPSIGFDILKIDREFVRAVDDRPLNMPVLNTIIDLAHDLGVEIVAEGVETVAQRDFLKSRNVQAIQGWLTGRPMEVARFSQWLSAQALHPANDVAASAHSGVRRNHRPTPSGTGGSSSNGEPIPSFGSSVNRQTPIDTAELPP